MRRPDPVIIRVSDEIKAFLVVETSMIVIMFPESNGKAAEALIAAPPFILDELNTTQEGN